MNVLLWLHSNSERPWTDDEKNRILSAAGQGSDLTAAKWLRDSGAEWPNRFYNLWPLISDSEPTRGLQLLCSGR
jgi:hypothetical protein